MTRIILFTAFSVLCACASAPRPISNGSCGVVTDPGQLDGCVGKTVTLRGKVQGSERPQIAGVQVAAGPELVDEPAHAVGTLEKADTGFALRDGDGLARAHGTRPRAR